MLARGTAATRAMRGVAGDDDMRLFWRASAKDQQYVSAAPRNDLLKYLHYLYGVLWCYSRNAREQNAMKIVDQWEC